MRELVAFLDHMPTRLCVTADRAFLRRLDGGCQVPIAAHAVLDGEELVLEALVADPLGKVVFRDTVRCAATLEEADAAGQKLAEKLLADGADKILAELYQAE